MYSLDINFLKDRPNYQSKSARGTGSRRIALPTPTGAFTPLYIGVALGLFLPALVGGLWFFVQQQNASLEQKQAQLDAELGRLKAFDDQIAALTTQTTAVKADTVALANVFNRIRPWSAILQDIRDRIPAGVQVKTIKQTTQVLAPAPVASPPPSPNPATPAPAAAIPLDRLSIVGTANSFDDVNDFMLLLQQSSFIKAKETQLLRATLTDNPLQVQAASDSLEGKTYRLPQVVEYEIQTTLNDVPAAVLVQELERKGAVGLVSRIKNLQSKGVLQQ